MAVGVAKYVEQTLGLLNNRKGLKEKDVNEKFKEAFPKWKQYFKLYEDSMKIAMKMWPKYSDALNKFEENYSSSYEGQNGLRKYSDELIKVCDTTGELISDAKSLDDEIVFNLEKIIKKMREYFESLNDEKKQRISEAYNIKPENLTFDKVITDYDSIISKEIKGGQSVLLSGFNKQRQEFASAIKKISSDFSKMKSSISEAVGILSKRSIKRNILQEAKTSPLKILKELHDSLKDNKNLPDYKGKDLLKLPKNKTLDAKLERSLQKVINCKWENYAEVSNKLGMKDLTRNINNMLESTDDAAEELEAGINFLKEIENSEPAHVLEKLEDQCRGVKSMYEVAKKEDKKLLSFFSSVLSFKLGASFIVSALNPLNNSIKDEINKGIKKNIARCLIEKTPSTFMKIIKNVLKAIEFLSVFAPVFGDIIGTIAEKAGEIINDVGDLAGTVKDVAEYIVDVN